MTLQEIKNLVASDAYGFLRENEHLGENIILLGLGGSHAYGTDRPTSDLDVRGIALNNKKELLTNISFEQFTNEETDTTIYSLNKMITLLSNCNPNTIEILGLNPEHYLYKSSIGQELLDNKSMFLSRKALFSFGGYASQQMYRLNQLCARQMPQTELERHILNSMNNMMREFTRKYTDFDGDGIKLYIDKSKREDYDSEIFMDIMLHHYPVRDYCAMMSELQNNAKAYTKIGKRNKHAMEHGKIAKHMVHIVRLFYMAFDILENGMIKTYREDEHDFLMEILNGKFIDENEMPTKEYLDLADELEKRLKYAADNTSLPADPDYERINSFLYDVNERIVLNAI